MSKTYKNMGPVLIESPHGWKDMVFWRYVPRKPFMIISSVVLSTLLYREWRQMGYTPGVGVINVPMDHKTVVVTGSTDGIGKLAVNVIARRGARVIMAARNVDKCAKMRRDLIHSTGNDQIFCRYLDMNSLSSVRKFADNVLKKEKEITTLVNCAGMQVNCKGWRKKHERRLTADGFEVQMGVNHFGTFLLTNLLAERLSESPSSSVINVLCDQHEFGNLDLKDINCDKLYEPRQAYRNSKLANVLFGRELARRLLDKKVKVVNLGFQMANTNLYREFLFRRNYVFWVLSWPMRWWRYMDAGTASMHVVAAVVDHFYDEHGEYITPWGPKVLDTNLVNDHDAMMLWKLSEKWVQLPHDYIADPHVGEAASLAQAAKEARLAKQASAKHTPPSKQTSAKDKPPPSKETSKPGSNKDYKADDKSQKLNAAHHIQHVASEAAAVATHL